MTDHGTDRARDALERLARSLGPVPPPRGLRAGRRPGLRGAALLAALLAVAAATTWWMRGTPPPAPAETGVVVEHLRIQGRIVEARVEPLPEAGAVMVTVAEEANETPAASIPGGDS